MMPEWKVKEQICDIGRRVWQRGYVAANDGNFSVRVDENRVLATPTMVSKGFMEPDDIVTLDLEGNKIGGDRTPTSETKLHLQIYRERSDVNAVIHVHPPHATAFAVAQVPLPKCVLPEVELFLGEIPIAEYGTPGTQAFANTIKPFLQDYNLYLLANHGSLALGDDLTQAYFRTEIVDQYCRILIYTRLLGGEKQITDDKMSELFQLKQNLGYSDPRLKPGGNTSCQIPSPIFNTKSDKSDEIVKIVTDVVKQVLSEREK